MTKIDNGGSAFPVRVMTHMSVNDIGLATPIYSDEPGMTLRDYFAGKALAEFANFVSVKKPETFHAVAQLSFEMADAMLAARAK